MYYANKTNHSLQKDYIMNCHSKCQKIYIIVFCGLFLFAVITDAIAGNTSGIENRPLVRKLIARYGKEKVVNCLMIAGNMDRMTHYVQGGYFPLSKVHIKAITQECIYRDMSECEVFEWDIDALLSGRKSMEAFKQERAKKEAIAKIEYQKHAQEWEQQKIYTPIQTAPQKKTTTTPNYETENQNISLKVPTMQEIIDSTMTDIPIDSLAWRNKMDKKTLARLKDKIAQEHPDDYLTQDYVLRTQIVKYKSVKPNKKRYKRH